MEVGKLQEDRSKAVIANDIAVATKAVEKASAEAQSCTAAVRQSSDGKLSSRMSSPIEQVRDVNRSNPQCTAEEDESSNTWSEYVARHHAKHEESESDDDDEKSDEDATVTNLRNPVEARRDGRTDVS